MILIDYHFYTKRYSYRKICYSAYKNHLLLDLLFIEFLLDLKFMISKVKFCRKEKALQYSVIN